MPQPEHFETDRQCLARLTALGSRHPDLDIQFMAQVVARLLAERVCESTEAEFRAGMAKGERTPDIAGTLSRAIVHEVLGRD